MSKVYAMRVNSRMRNVRGTRWLPGLLLALALALMWVPAWPCAAADKALTTAQRMERIEAGEAQVREITRAQRVHSEMVAALADLQQSDAIASLAAKVAEAEAAHEQALRDAALLELRAQLHAAQAARDAKVNELLSASPLYTAAIERHEALEQAIARGMTSARARNDRAALRELAEQRLEGRHLSRQLYNARRAMWQHAQVDGLYKQADALYKRYQAQTGAAEGVGEATQALREARQALEQAQREHLSQLGEAVAWIETEAAAREQALSEAREQVNTHRRALIGTQTWQHEVDVPQHPRRGQEREPQKAMLWIPPGVKQVRGIIVGHPPAISARLPTDAHIRTAAAAEGLAIIHFRQLDALFNYNTDSPQRLQNALDEFAQKSGHPELSHAPILTLGHSVAGIFARNVAYWQPDRVIGIVHIKSGNMHQHRPDPEKSFAGVPFLAINGEFEEFGPEGGIRPEYGRQTQWIMIREQMLRFRREDPNHLMSLIVHPGGDHGNWSGELTQITALFIRKAAQHRLPRTVEVGKPVTCRPLKAEDGWLSDARLKNPRHAPAAYADYPGDKLDAFWHFDREMAMAIEEYHAGSFILPDLAIDQPVPATWPGGR